MFWKTKVKITNYQNARTTDIYICLLPCFPIHLTILTLP